MSELTLEKGTTEVVDQERLVLVVETEEQNEAELFDFGEYKRRRMGAEAIRISAEELGFSDELTYLFNKLNHPELDITRDYETELAEKLKDKNHFARRIQLKVNGDDLVSLNDKKSVRQVTNRGFQVVGSSLANNPSLKKEFERALLEVREVDAIIQWSATASDGSFFVFESPPLMGNEDFVMTRIYRKAGEIIEACYVSLHNPSVAQINNLRSELGANKTDCSSPLEVLANPYAINEPDIPDMDSFLEYYVGVYDHLLGEKTGENYSYGYEAKLSSENINALDRVRSNPKLIATFTNTVELLAKCRGIITPEIKVICEKYKVEGAQVGQQISSSRAREILQKVNLGVAGAFIELDQEILDALEASDTAESASSDAAEYCSNYAQETGKSYDGICPSFEASVSQTESAAVGMGADERTILWAYGVYEKITGFGKPKIDVCRVVNCPSRGEPDKSETKRSPKKTLVGGCCVCLACHKMFDAGKKPQEIFEKREKERLAAESKSEQERIRRLQIEQAKEEAKIMQEAEHRQRQADILTKDTLAEAA